MSVDDTIQILRKTHRGRRFAMKIQQKLDRSLESFVRINATAWNPNADEKDREAENKKVKAIIKRVREGKHDDVDSLIIQAVAISDAARKPADEARAAAENNMKKLATDLPIAPWVKNIHGAGMLGFATIIAEIGNPGHYDNPAKIWKRLGYAPYDGYAGSTWKRESWRPRKLTSEEWIANPFSGERYALMAQVATWLVNTQWEGKAKSETGEGRPIGLYGQVYFDRREHTKKTHPDWTDMHRRQDALRIAMKRYLCDLWAEWCHMEKPDEPRPSPHRRERHRGTKDRNRYRPIRRAPKKETEEV